VFVYPWNDLNAVFPTYPILVHVAIGVLESMALVVVGIGDGGLLLEAVVGGIGLLTAGIDRGRLVADLVVLALWDEDVEGEFGHPGRFPPGLLEHLGDASHAPRLVEATDRPFQAIQEAEANAPGRQGGES
jgi:hypothetical protein